MAIPILSTTILSDTIMHAIGQRKYTCNTVYIRIQLLANVLLFSFNTIIYIHAHAWTTT